MFLIIEVPLYLIAEQPAPAPHLAHLEGRAALRNVLVTVLRVASLLEGEVDEHVLERLAAVAFD